MSTAMSLLVFLGGPILIFAVIATVVYATAEPREPGAPGGPPTGLTIEPLPCLVHTDADGREVHEPDPGGSDQQRCWRLACAECNTSYREGTDDDVHFAGPRHALAVARGRGWVLAGYRVRCRRCQ